MNKITNVRITDARFFKAMEARTRASAPNIGVIANNEQKNSLVLLEDSEK